MEDGEFGKLDLKLIQQRKLKERINVLKVAICDTCSLQACRRSILVVVSLQAAPFVMLSLGKDHFSSSAGLGWPDNSTVQAVNFVRA